MRRRFQHEEQSFLFKQRLNLVREVSGFGTRLLDRRARLGFRMSGNARSLVADLGHVGRKQNRAARGDEFADFIAVPCKELFGFVDAVELRAEALREDFARHDPVAFTAGVDPVACQEEGRVLGAAGLESRAHRRMDVDDIPALGPFAQQPLGVTSEVFVVRADHAGFPRILDRRRAEHDASGTGFQYSIAQRGAGVAKALRSALVGRQGHAVIHPVAGDHEVGLGGFQNAPQALADEGPAETETFEVVIVFFGREVGDRFAAQAEADDFNRDVLRRKPAVEISDVIAGLCDAVAEHDDASDVLEHRRWFGGSRRECGNDH